MDRTYLICSENEQKSAALAFCMPKVCHVLLYCSSPLLLMSLSYVCLANHILRCNIANARWFDR